MRLLDISGRWGGVTQYCCDRGVHVTTLTIVPDGARYILHLTEENGLPARVFLEDILNHKPLEPYDRAVTFGVIEHVPDYRRFARTSWDMLRPWDRLYLDGSAIVTKFAVSSRTRDYVWRGAHTFMMVQIVMAELLHHGFEVLEVKRENARL
ncbi:S-adenosyl-L-methionine-dependent methyltransferase [Aspergillus californicus]